MCLRTQGIVMLGAASRFNPGPLRGLLCQTMVDFTGCRGRTERSAHRFVTAAHDRAVQAGLKGRDGLDRLRWRACVILFVDAFGWGSLGRWQVVKTAVALVWGRCDGAGQRWMPKVIARPPLQVGRAACAQATEAIFGLFAANRRRIWDAQPAGPVQAAEDSAGIGAGLQRLRQTVPCGPWAIKLGAWPWIGQSRSRPGTPRHLGRGHG